MNGVVCEDNEESFYKAIEKVSNNLGNFNDSDIRDSFSEFSWENIFDTKMRPVLSANRL